MASLTQTSVIARKIVRYSIYGLIFIFIARFALNIGVGIFRFFFPEPPPPPTVSFGKLPELPFPDTGFSFEGLTFNLETVAGELPEFTDQLKVYFMPRASAGIKDLEIARQKAISLGFGSSSKELVETVFLFESRTAPATLTMNIVSGIFSISYDLRANPQATTGIPPAPEIANQEVKTFLARAGYLEDDLTGPVTHDFVKIDEGQFTGAASLSDADIIKVNFFRKDFDDLPSLSPDPNEASVWFMLSGGGTRRGSPIIAAEFHYYPIDEERNSTYPVMTAQDAWNSLKSGRGFIANLGNNSGSITIRRVYLAYYDPGQYTEFYQPIVVFEGDNDFTAYVPAVTQEYYGE